MSARDRPKSTEASNEQDICGVFRLRHSRIILEDGPAGVLARIEHDERGLEYGGPYEDPDAVRNALAEVSA